MSPAALAWSSLQRWKRRKLVLKARSFSKSCLVSGGTPGSLPRRPGGCAGVRSGDGARAATRLIGSADRSVRAAYADVIGSRGSTCSDSHEPRIQAWAGSSLNDIDRSAAGPASTFR